MEEIANRTLLIASRRMSVTREYQMKRERNSCSVRSIQNRTIWILWTQGFENAPEVVKLCLKSWKTFNPNWTIRALDDQALKALIDLPLLSAENREDITPQVSSDLARVSLLRRFGGVWTDATVFCCEPLDSWLEPYANEGFFAFRNPGPDRLMANWFIAANPENEILSGLHRDYVALWEHNRFLRPRHPVTRFSRRAFSRLFSTNPANTKYWFGFPRKTLKIFPYYIFHYTFNKLVLSDPALTRIWNKSLPFEATQPRRLTKLASFRDGITTALDMIEHGASPLYKLNWRIKIDEPYWQAVLSRLRSRVEAEQLSTQFVGWSTDDFDQAKPPAKS